MNTRVNVISIGSADLLFTLAEITRFQWEVFRRIGVGNVRDRIVLRPSRSASGETAERSVARQRNA